MKETTIFDDDERSQNLIVCVKKESSLFLLVYSVLRICFSSGGLFSLSLSCVFSSSSASFSRSTSSYEKKSAVAIANYIKIELERTGNRRNKFLSASVC
jgi:hypothetical protein